MRQVLVLVVLVLLMQVAVNYGLPSTDAPFDALTLVTTGFILIGAYSMGELFRHFRLPALLGYLAAGMLFGPKLSEILLGDAVFAPLSSSVLGELSLVNVLAVGVIGTMGGGEIKLSELRENFGKLAAICGVVFVLVLPLVSGTVMALTLLLPQTVPFLADLPLSHQIAGALLFGALAVGMSPAATLALLQEVRAHGRFTSLVLGVVVLGDLVLVATFLLILALARLLVSPEGFTFERLTEELPHIAAEFGWAIGIGVVLGVVFILYLRFVRREVLLFSLLAVFVTAFVAARVHAETLLAFLIAGFVVQNFSRYGHTLIEAFERISLPVFVIYFTAQAGALDLVSVTVYLPLTLVLVALRSSLFVFGVGFGARLANVDETSRRYLQMSFISQGGVDLVLAAMVAAAIPEWGVEVQTVTVATILFYVIGGPPFLARALDAMGESAAARERGAEQLESRARGGGASEAKATSEAETAELDLPVPRASDPALTRRLAALHGLVVGLAGTQLAEQTHARAMTRRDEMLNAAAAIRSALELTNLPNEPADVRQRVQALDRHIAARARTWSKLELEPLDRDRLERLFAVLADAVPFAASHRIAREATLFEAKGTRWSRVVRAARRLRRAVAGPGMRTVPVGRLWRYYVTLDVPVALWDAMQPDEARGWHLLLDHYRRTHAALTALADGSWRQQAAAKHDNGNHGGNHGHDEGGHGHEHASEATTPEPLMDRSAWIQQELERAQQRERALAEHIEALDRQLERGFVRALARAWTSFLDSVELAGTLELPAWRFRPSTRYDAAQAAAAELRERSERDREAAEGRRDGLRTLVDARRLAAAARASIEDLDDRLERALAPIRASFEHALGQARTLTTLPDGSTPEGSERASLAIERGRLLDAELDELASTIDQLRRRLLDLRMADLGEPGRVLAEVPELVAPSVDLVSVPIHDGRGESRTQLRLRAWLGQTIARELGVTQTVVEEQLATGLASVRVGVQHAREVLDYHLHLGSGTSVTDGIDARLGERIAALIGRAREELDRRAIGVIDQVRQKLGEAEQVAMDPLLSARWDEVRRRSRRLDDPRPVASLSAWLRERGKTSVARTRSLAGGLSDELSALLAERPTTTATEAYRQLLLGPRSSMPEPYQRLFTSVPAETIGLLIERPQLAVLREAIERWKAGRASPVLLWGERGAGKRTLVRQILGELGEAGDTVERHWLRLSPTLELEADVARELASALDHLQEPASAWERPPASDLAALFDSLRASASLDHAPPLLIVLENTERLFRRTPEGLEIMRRLLALISATGKRVQWIVLMAEAAVRVLDPALELRARFSPAIHVPPADPEQIERVLDARHRLSGYQLRREPGSPTLHEWLRSPTAALRLWRNIDVATSERVTQLSGGNLRQALRLWLAAARLDDHEPSVVVVGPLPSDACPLLDELPLSSKLLLASLMLHGPLLHSELERVHGQTGQPCDGSSERRCGEGMLDLDAELTRLVQHGLIVVEVDERSDQLLVSIQTRLVQPITSELRASNLL